MLEALGLNRDDELVYLALLRRPGAAVDDLGAATGIVRHQIHDSLETLDKLGLASRMPGRNVKYLPTPPDVALEVLIVQREAELRRARATARQLSESYRRAVSTGHPAELVEVVSGRAAVHQRGAQMLRCTKQELRGTDRPPHAGDPIAPNPVELDMLATGVAYRVVYDRATVEIPGWWAGHYSVMAAAGEQARVTSGVPVKMLIADGRLGLLAMQTENGAIEACVIVHPSELLEALCALFEFLWRQAVPLPEVAPAADDAPAQVPAGTAGRLVPAPFEATLVALLTAGLGDEAISRQTGLSYRTLQRRVRQLMDRLGAQTRFQAGLQAAFHGWVRPPATDEPD